MKHSRIDLLLAVLALATVLLRLACAAAEGAVVYVKSDSPGPTLNGASWATAFHTIQEGIDLAQSGDEVWVAAGTYVGPVKLKDGVELYGGFTGNETDLEERDWRANETVIDGEWEDYSVNIYQCPSENTTVDGFTITRGVCGVNSVASSPIIRNNVITETVVAGIYAFGNGDIPDPSLYRPMIVNNRCIKTEYYVPSAGMDFELVSPIVVNNVIADSLVLGIRLRVSAGIVANNTIVQNGRSDDLNFFGGGIGSIGSTTEIANNIIAWNKPYGLCANAASNALFHNNVYGNGLDFGSSAIAGTDDISADPLFVDAENGNYRLESDSPCIDAGIDDYAPDTDIDGIARPSDGNGDGTAITDIGAYEYTLRSYTSGVFFDMPGDDITFVGTGGGLVRTGKTKNKTEIEEPEPQITRWKKNRGT